MFIDELWMPVRQQGMARSSLARARAWFGGKVKADLPQLIDLQFPPGAILILFDGAQQKVDLGDGDFCQRVGPSRTARAGARASTQDTTV